MKRYILLLAVNLFTGFLSAQPDDRIKREYLSPVRILWKSNSELVRDDSCLLQTTTGQADLSNRNVARLKSSEGQTASVLLDFGKEIQGGLQLLTGMSPGNRPVNVRLRFGESVGEAMSEIGDGGGATNDHAMRDFQITLPWLGSIDVGSTGFRFVRIDLSDPNTELHLKSVRAISGYRDIPYTGSFSCNDSLLNQIWKTGAYTVHLNMQEYLWDGIKRDRLVWVGDLHPEVMTINAVFGYNEIVPKSLDLSKELTPFPGWMNGYSSYSIWWLLIQRDWYYHHGDIAYLRQQREYLSGLLRQLIRSASGGVEKLDGIRFLDWPSSNNNQAIDLGLQALMVNAMSAGIELCDVLGEKSLSDSCYLMMRELKAGSTERIQALSQIDPSEVVTGYKQGVALLSLAGLIDPQRADREFLSVSGAKGFSTFYGYYMLQAMALAGNYRGALDIIRQYWGGMLSLGATTFWEDFDIDWLKNGARIDELPSGNKIDVHREYGDHCYKGYRHSLCHGWSAGPTPWLSEYVLGIKVIEPGCRKVRIRPCLGDLDWAEGTYPTPYGAIYVRHERDKHGNVKSIIKSPKEVTVVR